MQVPVLLLLDVVPFGQVVMLQVAALKFAIAMFAR
jgi:hypothetical protein